MREKTWRGWRKPKPHRYPQWGMETGSRRNDVYRFFRYGEPGLMTTYIVPPSDYIDEDRAERGEPLLGNTAYKLLKPGIAVEDIVLSVVVIALLAVSAYAALGPAMDNWLDSVGL